MDSHQSEWNTVSGKRAPKCVQTKGTGKARETVHDSTPADPAKVVTALTECKLAVLNSSYYQSVTAAIQSLLARGPLYDAIFGLGIGTLTSPTSQLQLAIYLCLCEQYIKPDANLDASRGIFDPMTTAGDRAVYEELHLRVLTENTKGKQKVAGKVLFFLPHCPYRLYCNLVWANWENLSDVHIFGNRYHNVPCVVMSRLTNKAEHAVCLVSNPTQFGAPKFCLM
jgi:hypothetical protein